jgi:hypothetical protein
MLEAPTCCDEDTWYVIAVTKNLDGEVQVFVDMTVEGAQTSCGIDGGQRFDARIWSYARTQLELCTDAFATKFQDLQIDVNGLVHW